ncbi:hypothetical protein HPB48_015264 [Haemaphysalis longicornis]|uniref:RING-type domain-containing protein n=1 Tax=Haemaphysalis longicornis TaxID=44386 RepID=A0A9J6FSZ9_HAELO|nr:hypothetical protein HPB48_015264 [Haemaphysalis longicornis]
METYPVACLGTETDAAGADRERQPIVVGIRQPCGTDRVTASAFHLGTTFNMAHSKLELVLVGYSEDLETRPLKFVDPIPAARICGACGNVPRLTYSLLCGHIFCKPCYLSCVTTSKCVCPLDGEACAIKGVTSKEYPAENLLRHKVRRRGGFNFHCGDLAVSVSERVREFE